MSLPQLYVFGRLVHWQPSRWRSPANDWPY